MIVDPKRLFDEDDAELSAAIGAARRRVPSRDRLSGIAQRLSQAGVAVPPEFRPELTASEMPAAATATGAVSKGVVVALGVAGVALIGVLASIGFGSGSPASPPADVAAPQAKLQDPQAMAPHEAAVAAKAGVQSTTPVPAPIETVPVEPAPDDAVAKAAAPAHPTSPRKSPEPVAPPSEIELLKRARSALSSEPSLSLELVDRARQSFPQSSFGQEREFIAISALYKLGRRGEASARERAFRERHPRSAYLPQLDRLSSKP